jgi:hypothetical protein
VIACLDVPAVIGKILAHVERQVPSSVSTVPLPPVRGPPGQRTLELG